MHHLTSFLRIPRLLLAVTLAAGTLPGIGCRPPDQEREQAAVAEPQADSVSGPASAEPPDAAARPERIYYDLTRFDWYARGEPLLHEGSSYQPDGDGPVALDARALERVGEYGGVDFYRRGADTRLYVPVYEGYWQVFEPATAPVQSTGR